MRIRGPTAESPVIRPSASCQRTGRQTGPASSVWIPGGSDGGARSAARRVCQPGSPGHGVAHQGRVGRGGRARGASAHAAHRRLGGARRCDLFRARARGPIRPRALPRRGAARDRAVASTSVERGVDRLRIVDGAAQRPRRRRSAPARAPVGARHVSSLDRRRAVLRSQVGQGPLSPGAVRGAARVSTRQAGAARVHRSRDRVRGAVSRGQGPAWRLTQGLPSRALRRGAVRASTRGRPDRPTHDLRVHPLGRRA